MASPTENVELDGEVLEKTTLLTNNPAVVIDSSNNSTSQSTISTGPMSSTKANLQKLEATVPNDVDYDVWLLLPLVHEVNDRMKNSLYGYLIGKRLAFPIVFTSIEGVDSVL
ncbi:hypothetical protein Tco_1389715 [Tanacetum coccineum]